MGSNSKAIFAILIVGSIILIFTAYVLAYDKGYRAGKYAQEAISTQTAASPSDAESVSKAISENSAPATTVEPLPEKVYGRNEIATLNGTEISISKVGTSAGSEFDKPKSGCDYIIVMVKVKNTGSSTISYNPFYFKMQNSKGQITDSVIFTSVDDKYHLNSGELAPNGEVEGTIVFEEPKKDNGLILVYEPGIFDNSNLKFTLTDEAPEK